mmetsp:Transcript_723/g.2618  ORF Transcript_723/g.2618 Transcript_723/m.2618 type:complete len:225 (-) Transcript_723:1343-2017(-)
MPSCEATAAAAGALSPVSMHTSMPCFSRASSAALLVSRTVSVKRKMLTLPSMTRADLIEARSGVDGPSSPIDRRRSACAGGKASDANANEPKRACTGAASPFTRTVAVTPRPWITSKLSTHTSGSVVVHVPATAGDVAAPFPSLAPPLSSSSSSSSSPSSFAPSVPAALSTALAIGCDVRLSMAAATASSTGRSEGFHTSASPPSRLASADPASVCTETQSMLP